MDLSSFTHSIFRNSVRTDFEKEVATYTGTKYAVLCSSGRTAIFFSLLGLGVKPKDEVIIPDYSCQILPITVFCTGSLPKFCDIDLGTLGLSYDQLEKTIQPKTKAVILVHPYGNPVNPSPFLELAEKKDLFIISDAAQAISASIKGKNVSSFGDVGIISFNKFLDVNLGAAVVTDRENIAEKIKLIRNQYEFKSYFSSFWYKILRSPFSKIDKLRKKIFSGSNYLSKFFFNRLSKKHFQIENGWVKAENFLLENFENGVLNRSLTAHLMAYNSMNKYSAFRKMEDFEILDLNSKFMNLNRIHNTRTDIAEKYSNLLKETEFNKFFLPDDFISASFRYPILFSEETKRNICFQSLSKAGFKIDYCYKPLHQSPLLDFNQIASFRNSLYLTKHLLPLPINSNLRSLDVNKIIEIVNSSITK